jgi:Zn finger protein HypA/HybF involved in hydrogenase expression
VHELSVALEVARLAERTLGTERLSRLITVGLEVGEDSGIEIANLEFCLEAVFSTPPFWGAKPEITLCAGSDLRLTYLELEE